MGAVEPPWWISCGPPNGLSSRSGTYVLAIDDFERLTNAAASEQIELPAFLASCVGDDEGPETALRLFEQHLNRRQIPLRFSRTVEQAVEASLARLEEALSG